MSKNDAILETILKGFLSILHRFVRPKTFLFSTTSRLRCNSIDFVKNNVFSRENRYVHENRCSSNSKSGLNVDPIWKAKYWRKNHKHKLDFHPWNTLQNAMENPKLCGTDFELKLKQIN